MHDYWKRLALILGLSVCAFNALSATCTSTGGDWQNGSSWSGCSNNQPAGGSNVVIANGTTIKVEQGTSTVANITINAGGTLNVSGNQTISLTGNFTTSGAFNAGTGLVSLVGTSTQTITGNVTFNDLTVGSNTAIAIASGTAVVVSGTATIPPAVNFSVAAGSSLTVGGVTYTCSTAYSGAYSGLASACSGGGGGGAGGGGSSSCSLPSSLTSGSTLNYAGSGFSLNTNGGSTSLVNSNVSPTKTYSSTGSLNALSTTAAPTVSLSATLPALVPTTFPSIAGTNGARTINSGTTTIAPGSYTNITVNGGTAAFSGGATATYIQNLSSTAANTTLQFAPGDYYIDSLTVDGNLTVSPSGLVRIFIGTQQTGTYGNASTTGGNNNNGFGQNAQINTGGNPGNLQFLLYPLVTYFEFNDGADFTGIMYQPSVSAGAPRPNWGLSPGQFDLHTGVTITGALITPGMIETWGSNTFYYTPQVAAAVSSFSPCGASAVDHFAISHSGTGVTCQAEPITVIAHNSSHAVLTTYTGTVTLSTSTGRGDWSLITGSGTLTPGAPNSGAATYTFVAADAGDVVLGLKDTFAETVSLGVTNGTATLASGSSTASERLSLAFSNAGFSITDAAGNAVNIGSQVAGQTSPTLYLQAVKTAPNGACTGVFTGTVNIEMASMCNNPPSCAGKVVTINSTALNVGTGNGTIPATGLAGVNVPLNFGANSIAPFTLNYPDVGQITLAARHSMPFNSGASSGNYMVGNSNPFVVAPAKFGVVNATAPPIKAGTTFNATITAQTTTGVATPNFGKETTPASITLTQALASPAGTPASYVSAGSLAPPSYSAWSAGVSTASTTWSEVGLITLTATTSNYLNSGLNATGSSASMGPFIPDHFDTTVAPGCSSCGFTYSSQPFAVTVTARNALASPGTTQNYDGSVSSSPNYAKAVTLTAWDAATGTTQNPSGSLLPGTSTALAASAFKQGVATLNTVAVMPYYTLTSTTTAPTSIRIRATETSATPAVTSQGFTEGTTEVRGGRILLPNAYGSERLALPLTVTVQYYNGSQWVASALDNSTTFDTTLSTAGGNLVATVKSGLASGISVSNPGAVSVTAGQRSVVLNAVGQVQGSVWISVNAPSYLPSNQGLATFGVYKSPLIYRRENY